MILTSPRRYQLSAIFSFIIHTTVQSYSTHSPKFTGLKLDINYFCICTLIFCWIRIRNNNSDFCWIRIRNNNSGSREKFRIHVDPDPQQCNKVIICCSNGASSRSVSPSLSVSSASRSATPTAALPGTDRAEACPLPVGQLRLQISHTHCSTPRYR